MIRAVIDANVFVSATLIEGTPPAQIIDAWQDGKFELITSASIIKEIKRVIYYPKVRRRSPYSEKEIEELLALLERKSTRTPEELKLEIVKTDPADDKYIIAAVESVRNSHCFFDVNLLQLNSKVDLWILMKIQKTKGKHKGYA